MSNENRFYRSLAYGRQEVSAGDGIWYDLDHLVVSDEIAWMISDLRRSTTTAVLALLVPGGSDPREFVAKAFLQSALQATKLAILTSQIRYNNDFTAPGHTIFAQMRTFEVHRPWARFVDEHFEGRPDRASHGIMQHLQANTWPTPQPVPA